MRHRLSTRLWHWINAASLIVLFMSGLTISNAHRYLYWGDVGSSPEEAWISVVRFPDWMTIPGRYDLASARDWHSLASWPFAWGLLAFWLCILINRHFVRHIALHRSEWHPAVIWRAAKAHLKGDFTYGKSDRDAGDEETGDGGGDKAAGEGGTGKGRTGESSASESGEARKYGLIQRLSYGAILGIALPGMVITGLAISPGIEPAAPWLIEALGGRQSARSLHFILAFTLAGFLAVHVVMVGLTGPVRQIKDMILGGRNDP